MGYRRQFELRWQIALEQQQLRAQSDHLRPVVPPAPQGGFWAAGRPHPRGLLPEVTPGAWSNHTWGRDVPFPSSLLPDAGAQATVKAAAQAAAQAVAAADDGLREWTVDQVCEWAVKQSLPSEVVDLLRSEAISGAVLPTLTEADMFQMGLLKLGHRRQLTLALAELLGVHRTEASPAAAADAPAKTENVTNHVSRRVSVPRRGQSARHLLSNPVTGSADSSESIGLSISQAASKGSHRTSASSSLAHTLGKEASTSSQVPSPPTREALDDDVEALIYAICDPFEVEETANQQRNSPNGSTGHVNGERKVTTGFRAGGGYDDDEMDEEALMYALLDPNEMVPVVRKMKSQKSVRLDLEDDRVRSVDSTASNVAEYWQDITAIRAVQRQKSQLKLEMCSRRGYIHNGVDVDEPPELAQARAKAEEDAELQMLLEQANAVHKTYTGGRRCYSQRRTAKSFNADGMVAVPSRR